MTLGMAVGLVPSHIVLDWAQLRLREKGAPPPPPNKNAAHAYYGQRAAWIKMPLGTLIDLGPGHIVLDGDPALPQGAQPPVFGPCLLWPDGSMERDATWYERRPRPWRHCFRWGPAPSQKAAP